MARVLKYTVLFLPVFFQSLSIVLVKKAASDMDQFTALNVITNVYYVLSILSLGLQAVFWQIVLKMYRLSVAYFAMSGVYVIILCAGFLVFNESVSLLNIAGTAVICLGIFVIIGGESHRDA